MRRDHDFFRLVRAQLAGDIKALPTTISGRFAEGSAAQGCINIAELRDLARRRLPRLVFDFVDGAAGDEKTAGRNRSDLDDLVVLPHVLQGASAIDLSTEILGERVGAPLVGAPTGLTRVVHPAGEVGIARAVDSIGGIYTLSTAGSSTMEEVAVASNGPKWFQLYLGPDRVIAKSLLEHAARAGYRAVVVTVDTPRAGARERDQRNGGGVGWPHLGFRALRDGVRCPRWTANFFREPHLLSHGVLTEEYGDESGALHQYVARQFDATMRWEDIEWVQENWDGPVLLKGVLRPEDAVHARGLGLAGVIVSNHGGRQLDQAPSSISALPAVVDAVGSDIDVFLDGGMRRGIDVVKALSLGARACLVGRAFVFGLAAGGEAGAQRAATILVNEMRLAMTLLGAASVEQLDRSYVGPASRPRSLATLE